MAQVNANTTDIATNWLLATRLLGDFKSQVSVLRRAEASNIMSGKPDVPALQARRVTETRGLAAVTWKAYLATVEFPEERALVAEVETARDRYYAALDKSISGDGSTPEAHDKLLAHYESESMSSFDALSNALARDV